MDRGKILMGEKKKKKERKYVNILHLKTESIWNMNHDNLTLPTP